MVVGGTGATLGGATLDFGADDDDDDNGDGGVGTPRTAAWYRRAALTEAALDSVDAERRSNASGGSADVRGGRRMDVVARRAASRGCRRRRLRDDRYNRRRVFRNRADSWPRLRRMRTCDSKRMATTKSSNMPFSDPAVDSNDSNCTRKPAFASMEKYDLRRAAMAKSILNMKAETSAARAWVCEEMGWEVERDKNDRGPQKKSTSERTRKSKHRAGKQTETETEAKAETE